MNKPPAGYEYIMCDCTAAYTCPQDKRGSKLRCSIIKKREFEKDSHYWVRDSDEWFIGKFDGVAFRLCGYEEQFFMSDLCEIGEEIKR